MPVPEPPFPQPAGGVLASPPRVERIAARASEVGEGFTVRRALPTRQRRMIGAWCFLDHLGPAALAPGQRMRVGAHPHTGLQTFTWMMEGEILHRDSLGSEQVIRPGQINLMTAGRGIAHTEDSLPGVPALHAAQLWIALPPGHAAIEPAFDHYPELPSWREAGVAYTLLAGRWADRSAPTRLYAPLLGLDIQAQQAARVVLPLDPGFEHGLLALQGHVRVETESGPERFDSADLVYLAPGASACALELEAGSRLLLIGGAPAAEPVTMWWNFVGYSRADVAQAQADWEAGSARFGPVPGGEDRRLTAPALPWSVA